jgi:hypothetical protein
MPHRTTKILSDARRRGSRPILDVAPKTMLQLWQHMQAVRAKQRSNVVSITATPKNRSHSCRA